MRTIEIEGILQKYVKPCKRGIAPSDISIIAKEIAFYFIEKMPKNDEINEWSDDFIKTNYTPEKFKSMIKSAINIGASWMGKEILSR